MKLFCAAAVLALGIAPAGALAADIASAEIMNTDNKVIGKAIFEQVPTGVIVTVEVNGLPPGLHGIHLHSVGACAPDFKAAKGHINPKNAKHGLRNPDGPDNGDLPNLYVAADGGAKAQFLTTRVSVASDSQPALLDGDGSAVVIHDKPDDHMAQPIGGAGDRIGCGIIRKM